MTQQALADRLYVATVTIRSWERGRTVPDIETGYRMAEVLGVSVKYLVTGEEDGMTFLDMMLDVLRCAMEHNQYGYVAVTIPGQKALEYIINEPESLENKIAYYKKAYNPDGVHRMNPEVRIVSAGCLDKLPVCMLDLLEG